MLSKLESNKFPHSHRKRKRHGIGETSASFSDRSVTEGADGTTPKANQSSRGKENEGLMMMMSNLCHQCQRNDMGRVVRCTKCKSKRYCIPCIQRWYPGLTEEAVSASCPFCCLNCNCKACMRMECIWVRKELNERAYNVDISGRDRILHSLFLLQAIMPSLSKLNEEQLREKEVEAAIQGLPLSNLEVKKIECPRDVRVYCDHCKSSIFDFHRCCPLCTYELCLICCREIRDGHPQGGAPAVVMEYVDRGSDYLHGFNDAVVKTSASRYPEQNTSCSLNAEKWKANADGSIPCPPKKYGGCGGCLLELQSMFFADVNELTDKASKVLTTLGAEAYREVSSESCSCVCSSNGDDRSSINVRIASSRGGSNDDHLYCPAADDISVKDFKHFQRHWARAEPVIIRNVLELTTGLSWEPMVMWRALRQITNANYSKQIDLEAIDCLGFIEVDVNIREFFKGYSSVCLDSEGWPRMLKLKDWPPSTEFDKVLPRMMSSLLLLCHSKSTPILVMAYSILPQSCRGDF